MNIQEFNEHCMGEPVPALHCEKFFSIGESAFTPFTLTDGPPYQNPKSTIKLKTD